MHTDKAAPLTFDLLLRATLALLAAGCTVADTTLPTGAISGYAPPAPNEAPDAAAEDMSGTDASPLSILAYVDHDHPCRDEPHASSPSDPYCEITSALPATGAVLVKLAPSATPYLELELGPTSALDVTLLGPGADLATIAGGSGAAISVYADYQPERLVVRGVTLKGGTLGAGLRCNGKSDLAHVSLSQVTLTGGGQQGLNALGCHVSVDHALVRGNAGGLALVMCTYELSDDLVTRNHGRGVDVSASTGTMTRLVITDNTAAGVAGLRCTLPNEITDSLIGGNQSTTLGRGAAQVDPRCVLVNTQVEAS